MFKQFLAVCALGFMTVSAAHATSISAGETVAASPLSYGGPRVISSINNITTPTFSVNYAEDVYADPNNVYCPGCLDFVFLLNNVGTTGVISLSTAYDFSGYLTNVGYVANGTTPTTISMTSDGTTIGFNFPGSDDLTPNAYSSFLVIQTNADQYGPGYLSIAGTALTGSMVDYGPAGTPVSPVPEPSSLFLLGTGILGVARLAKMKYGA